MTRTPLRLTTFAVALLLFSCSSGSGGGGGMGGASGNGATSAGGGGAASTGGSAASGGSGGSTASGWVCRHRDDRMDPRDGCYCDTLAPGEDPLFPLVANCDDTFAGAGKTVCCRDADSCLCVYVGCDSNSITDTCQCGADHSSAILSSMEEVSTCSPLPGGRCCKNETEHSCGCDTLDTQCGAQYGDYNVPTCTATTVVPGCWSGKQQVDSCNTP